MCSTFFYTCVQKGYNEITFYWLLCAQSCGRRPRTRNKVPPYGPGETGGKGFTSVYFYVCCLLTVEFIVLEGPVLTFDNRIHPCDCHPRK